MTPQTIERASRYDDADLVATIKQTVCKGATDAQLRMFLEVCKKTGLDPFLKEVWYIAEKNLIMAGRDGYLRVANENPQFDGMDTRVERDENNKPIKATCSVWRKDRNHPITCEAYYSEYKKASPVWTQYPSAMISKVAEVLALKRSFSINGVVTEEEIGNDGSGSRAAAQDVAERKMAEMKAGTPYTAVTVGADAGNLRIEAVPEPVLEKQLSESLDQQAKNMQMMREAFAVLEQDFKKLGSEELYFAELGSHGVENAGELKPISKARKVYKQLGVLLAELKEAANEETADRHE